MIGIVVVSHSRPLAEAATALAREMAPPDACPAIGIAAGIDVSDRSGSPGTVAYGTDADAVAEAITAVDSPDGVLVLMDLGSAVLSAQFALELLDPDVAGRVRLCPAPLVEGLITAVAAAGCGASLERAAEQAESSLGAKHELVGDRDDEAAGSAAAAEAPGNATDPETAAGARDSASPAGDPLTRTREVLVSCRTGLHLRPASVLAALAAAYDADVLVSAPETSRGPVSCDSLTGLLTLGAEQGHHLRLEARGPEADAVLEAIGESAASGFGEEP